MKYQNYSIQKWKSKILLKKKNGLRGFGLADKIKCYEAIVIKQMENYRPVDQ